MPARATGGPKGERPPRICNVATKCVSREDFLRSFAPFVDDTTLFIPTKLAFELGQLVRFQVSLADGTVVLAGIGEACELLTGPTGPLGKSGVRFLIKEIDEASRAVRDDLAARRRKAVAAGVAAPAPPAPAPRAAPPPRAPMVPPARASAQMAVPVASPLEPRPDHPPTVTPMAELRPDPRFELQPEPRAVAHPERRPDFHPSQNDAFNEATLNATDPLEGEHTRQDLKAEALGRMATESNLAAARPLRFAQPPPEPPPLAPLGPPALEDEADALEELQPSRLRRLAPIVLATAAALLIAFLIWMRVNRPAKPVAPPVEVAAVEQAPPAPEPAPTPAPPPAAKAAPQLAKPEAEPLPPAPAPVAREKPAQPPPAAAEPVADAGRPRKCQARIDSKPRGAIVTLGQLTLGRTPISRAAVPCGAASVTITHPRYAPATVNLQAGPSAPVSVSARLSRPSAQLQLASSPQGAVFRVGSHTVGRGPRNVNVSRFETVRVEARLPGMKPWVRKIYTKDSVTEVMATFER